ncbi:hypothetical protein H5410_000222 [Solanum commersonii]|uniref:60S acidic ribosomal protein P1 n=1 Tax=Solanum commersonii TaxID=4109 RepID=A0A9J6AVW3_SOLCO|nr:hypothetical protein H5410_000222 [Solanum commersonii]
MHVQVSAETYEKVDAAVALIELLVTPASLSGSIWFSDDSCATTTKASGDGETISVEATPGPIPPVVNQGMAQPVPRFPGPANSGISSASLVNNTHQVSPSLTNLSNTSSPFGPPHGPTKSNRASTGCQTSNVFIASVCPSYSISRPTIDPSWKLPPAGNSPRWSQSPWNNQTGQGPSNMIAMAPPTVFPQESHHLASRPMGVSAAPHIDVFQGHNLSPQSSGPAPSAHMPPPSCPSSGSTPAHFLNHSIQVSHLIQFLHPTFSNQGIASPTGPQMQPMNFRPAPNHNFEAPNNVFFRHGRPASCSSGSHHMTPSRPRLSLDILILVLINMSCGEVACTYAALLLHDEDIPITAEKISTLVKAANVTVEPYWPLLFAKLAEKRNLGDLIMNVGAGGGGGGGAVAVAAPTGGAGGGAAAAAPAAEEKKEEPKEESDDDMGFSLFD